MPRLNSLIKTPLETHHKPNLKARFEITLVVSMCHEDAQFSHDGKEWYRMDIETPQGLVARGSREAECRQSIRDTCRELANFLEDKLEEKILENRDRWRYGIARRVDE